MAAEAFTTPAERFDVLDELHDSLFGKVYKALDRQTNKNVAVKVSHRKLVDSKRTLSGMRVLESVRDECAVMRALQENGGHPNVLRLEAEVEDDKHHWMAMEYCSAGDFHAILTDKKLFNEDMGRAFFRQMLRGIIHIHRNGYCHLDLSLENLLLDGKGVLKICDFGLARKLPEGGDVLTLGERRPGKLKYLAPEILTAKSFNPQKAETYSLGVILFLMLAGQPPYEAPSNEDEKFVVLKKKGAKKLLENCGADKWVSEGAADLLSKLLEMKVKKRANYQQIVEHSWVQEDLDLELLKSEPKKKDTE